MKSKTELWSHDPGKGRSIQATITTDERNGMSLFDMKWDDGTPVQLPVRLTPTDVRNLNDLLTEQQKEMASNSHSQN